MTNSSSDIKRYAGLDLAKESIFACIIDKNGLKKEKKFKTDLNDLLNLIKWLNNYNVVAVVMEHTGVYTEPVKFALQNDFRLELVNPADVKSKNKKRLSKYLEKKVQIKFKMKILDLSSFYYVGTFPQFRQKTIFNH